MKGVKFLKGTPINPTAAEVPKPTGELQVPGQSMTTADLAAQSMQNAQAVAARNAQVASSASSTLASAVQASGVTYPREGFDLAGLGKMITETYSSITQARAERESQQALFDLTRDAEQLRLNALNIVSSDGGLASYETATANLLKRYRERVPYDAFEQIFSNVTNAGRDAYSTVNGRLYQQSQELEDAATAMKEREILLSLRPFISQMSSVDPTRRADGWTGIQTYLEELATSGEVDMASYFRIGTSVLDAALEADIQPGLIEAARNRLNETVESITLQQQAYVQWAENPSPQGYMEYDKAIFEILAQYPDAPILASDPAVFLQQYQALQDLQQRQNLLIAESPTARAALEGAQDLPTGVIDQLALFLMHPSQGRIHRTQIEQLEAQAERAGLTSDWPAVLAQSEFYEQTLSRLTELNREVNQANTDLQKLRSDSYSDIQNQLLRWRRAVRGGTPDNLGMMVILRNPLQYGLTDEDVALLEQPELTPEELERLSANLDALERAERQAVAEQYNTLSQEREQLISPLRQLSAGEQRLIIEVNGNPVVNNEFFNQLVPLASETLQSVRNRIQQVNAEISAAQQGPPLGTRAGGRIAPFSNPSLHRQTIEGVEAILPFHPTDDVIPLTGEFGEPRRTHNHGGVDLGVPIGTPILNYIAGTVEAVGDYGNYGNLVDVRASDGSIHRFAHLSDTNVIVGHQVMPGDVLGLSGNTGNSRGAHLHWEVILDADSEGNGTKVDPLQWSSQHIVSQPYAVRGQSNPTPQQLQGVPLDNGGYLQNGLIYDAEGRANPAAYTANAPMYPAVAPTVKSQTPSDPSFNYGYQVVADDTRFRTELHRMAARLDIPAQWILDVMALETGGTFDPDSKNYDERSRAFGLIQFLPSTIRGLQQNHPDLDEADLYSGDRTRQLKWVEAYLSEMSDKIDTVYDLAVGIFLGEPRLDQYQANPDSIRRAGDFNIGISAYVDKLGKYAGRRYRPIFPTGSEIHTRPVRGCTTCMMMSTNFQPHESYE